MILNDRQILELCENSDMIQPFSSKQIREREYEDAQHGPCVDKIISYGVTSFGYDGRLARDYKIFHNANNALIDPKNFNEDSFIDKKDVDSVIIPPNSFVLARTMEYFTIPQDVLAICVGKSTYARCGLIVNVTPLEPGWEGYLTLEISNTTPLPAIIYSEEGICQFIFFRGIERPITTYSDRGGKYMRQEDIVTAKV